MDTTRFVDVLFGGIVALVGFPLVAGPVVGGWLAGRRSERSMLDSALAGLAGGLPWGVLTALAMAGRVPEWGYHRGWMHLGVKPAPPGMFVAWQEVGVGWLVVAVCVGLATTGGAFVRLVRARVEPPATA